MGQNVYSISSERWKQERRNSEYKSNLPKSKKKSNNHSKRNYRKPGAKSAETCLKMGTRLGFPRDLVLESIRLHGLKKTISLMRSYEKKEQKRKVAGL